jgi:transcription-repair coupling factor (superfamily II helicase)
MVNGQWVSDCTLESDLELYFPDQYVPSDSERMLLYRELDGLHTDDQLVAYRKRLIDRFGAVPHVGEELMRVVPLRRLGKSLGCEKIFLKQQRMTLFFVSQQDSPYYQRRLWLHSQLCRLPSPSLSVPRNARQTVSSHHGCCHR